MSSKKIYYLPSSFNIKITKYEYDVCPDSKTGKKIDDLIADDWVFVVFIFQIIQLCIDTCAPYF